jgi:hypothetical protein
MHALVVVSVLALVGCVQQRRVLSSTPPPPAVSVVRPLPIGPASAVVTLELDVATAVAWGPFLITSINPGSELRLGLAERACDEPGLVWFLYSGGGVAVGAGQLLCARSFGGRSTPQAFSGRHEAVPDAKADAP